MTSKRFVIRTAALISVSSLALPVAAHAADAAAEPAASSPATPAPPSDDIVVTAQRREQKLQDVGIAVSALSPVALRNLSINEASDVVRAVPSLKMNSYGSSQVVFNIRGISQNDFGDQQEPPVAVYQDDSYGSSLNLASFPTFDLLRVEVLRGPQGTLFGRNATGGAIQFISAKPQKEFGGYLRVTVGNFGKIITEGAVTGPLADNVQVRLSGIRDRDSGYLDNILPGKPNQAASNHYALRAIIAWQPSSTIDTKLTLRYTRAPNERQAGIYGAASACPNAKLQGEFTGATETCAYWASYPGVGPGTTATGYRNDSIMPQFGGDHWKTAAGEPGYVDRTLFGASYRIEAKLGAVDLVSITDYQYGKKFLTDDEDSTPDGATNFSQGSRLDQGSQELRLVAHLPRNELTVGAYGMVMDGKYYGSFGDPFLNYIPVVNFTQKTQSWAVFAQDEWKFAEKFKLIVGARFWHDHRIGSYVGTEASTGVGLIFNRNEISATNNGVPIALPGLNVTTRDATPNFSGFTARAELDYKVSDNLLTYFSYNRGSKSGGFTFSLGTPYPGSEVTALNLIPYRPEKLDDWEIGVKATLAPGTTLNVAGFIYDYHDYQAFAQNGFVQSVVNLPARAKGVEAEFVTKPVKGLTINLSAQYLDSHVYNVPLIDGSLKTSALPQAPKFSGSALVRYEFPVLGGTGSIQGDVLHSGSFCFTVLCAPVESEGSYQVANLRFGFTPASDRWDFSVYVNNVTKSAYRIYAFDESLFGGNVAQAWGRPRMYGASLTYRFGNGG
jgi:iron complex outermembrane recepter protein